MLEINFRDDLWKWNEIAVVMPGPLTASSKPQTELRAEVGSGASLYIHRFQNIQAMFNDV